MSKAKIISWNVNGIRAILKKNFANYIDQLKPDILALQEVKCDDLTVLNQIFTELGYSYYVNCAVKKGYSGVLVAWKNFVKADLLPFDLLHDAYKNEGRSLFVDFGYFKLLNLYVPSGTSSEERHEAKLLFMKELRSNLSKADLSKFIICGDFNICHKDNDIHHPQIAEKKNFSGFRKDERLEFSELLELGLVDIVREFNPEEKIYTWWSYRANSREKNLGWRIDYFLVSNNFDKNKLSSEVHTGFLGSDHCPISLELAL